MLNNRIGAFVLVLITLFVAAGADACGQDDYGRIEVLGEWQDSGTSGIQAYGDTILRSFTGKQPRPSRDIQISIDGGVTWKHVVTVSRLREFIPTIGSRLTAFEYINDLFDVQEYWTIRRGKLEHHDTIGVDEKKGMLPFTIMQYHPIVEGLIFAVGTVKGRVSTYETLYTSTDDGRTWREYELPEASQGLSRKVTVRVDYANPNYLFVAVNGGDGVGNPEIEEWYRLVLETGELTSHPNIGILNNYWRKNTTVHDVFRSFQPNVPVICDFNRSACDTLRWSDRIQESLLSEYQVQISRLFITPLVGWFREDTPRETFHPMRRGVYVTTVSFPKDTGREAPFFVGVVITLDTGRTWTWLIRPEEYVSYSSFSLDPITMNVYMTRTRSVSQGTKYFAMLKIVPTVLRVENTEAVGQIHVFPNPASETVTLGELFTETTTVRVVDVQGQSYVCPCFPHADGSLVVNIRHVPSGIYYVDVLTHERRRFIPIVVQQ